MTGRVIGLLALGVLLSACQEMPAARTGAQEPAATSRPAVASTAPAPAPRIPAGATIVLPPIDAHAGAIPPELIAALQQMTAEDFHTREDAVGKLEAVMTHQFRQMVQLQDLLLRVQQGLADQLSQLTQTPDAEGKKRVAGLMEFNSAVSQWAVDVMALPGAGDPGTPDKGDSLREQVLRWGIEDAHLPLVARAYNMDPVVRMQAARELGKIAGPEADWMLLQLMNDQDRAVSLTAMDAVGNRPPTPGIMDALWNRAVGPVMNQLSPRATRQRTVTIRGRTIVIYDQSANTNSQDADIAVDILIGMHSPEVTQRLNSLFTDLATSVGNNNDSRWRIIMPNYGGDAGRAISRLMDAYHPRAAVPFLLKVLESDSNDGSEVTINNEKMRYSSRIDAAALLISTTGQDADTYHIIKSANFGNRWVIKGDIAEENTEIKKLVTWGKAHLKDEGAGVPDAAAPAAGGTPGKPAATAPAGDLVVPE